jgi:hypothetical protein
LTVGETPVRLDEYYTLFAAQSWVQDGSFAILDGSYERAPLFTILTGWVLAFTGEAGIAAARLPSILATAVSAAWLFAWLRRTEGMVAALVATLVFATSGWALDSAHFARFYALQNLLILIAATMLFDASQDTRGAVRRRIAAAALLLFAVQLQPTTLVAGVALLIWLAPSMIRAALALHLARQTPILLAGAAVSLAAMLVLLPVLIAAVEARFLNAPLWAAPHRDDALFYVQDFWTQAPLLMLLLPVVLVLAFRRSPTLAGFALVMLVVPVLIHSFAAMKAARYCTYTVPFLGVLYGLGMAAPLERLHGRLSAWLGDRGVGQPSSRLIMGILLLSGGMIVLLANPTYRHTARAARLAAVTAVERGDLVTPPRDTAWESQASALRRLIARDEFLVTADDLRTLAFLRPYDVALNATLLSDFGAAGDFFTDPRTGRPIVASAAGVEQLLRCRRSGVILADREHWRVAKGIPPAVADVIERGARRQDAPAYFLLFRWQNERPVRCGAQVTPDGGRA